MAEHENRTDFDRRRFNSRPLHFDIIVVMPFSHESFWHRLPHAVLPPRNK